jgi:hypothetical protein
VTGNGGGSSLQAHASSQQVFAALAEVLQQERSHRIFTLSNQQMGCAFENIDFGD